MELQRKTTLNFIFKHGKQKKNKKFLKQMLIKTLAKDPSYYKGREVKKNEQVSIEISSHDDQITRPTIVEITSK